MHVDDRAVEQVVGLLHQMFGAHRRRPGGHAVVVTPVSDGEVRTALRAVRKLTPEQLRQSRRVAATVMERSGTRQLGRAETSGREGTA